MKILDLTDVKWNSLQSTSMGIIPKAISDKFFIKLSSYNEYDGFYGEEPLYEELAYEIGNIFELNIVPVETRLSKVIYNGKVHEVYASISPNYSLNKQFVSIEKYMVSNNMSVSDLLNKFKNELSSIVEFDFLINNIDRHGRNIELNEFEIAPIFDNSLSFFSKISDSALSEKLYSNYSSNNYLGSHNLLENLKLIDKQLDLNVGIEKLYNIVDNWGIKYNKSIERIDFIKGLLKFRYGILQDKLSTNTVLKWE